MNRLSSSETFIIDEKGYLIRDTSDFSVSSCEITSLPLQKAGHQFDSKGDCGLVELLETEQRTSVRQLSDDEDHYGSGTDSDEEDSSQNMTIDVALIEFDEHSKFTATKIDTPGRLPPPNTEKTKFFFWNKQFLVPSHIFYRTTGGQVVYDENQKKLVTHFMDKTQSDCLNYDAIRSFLKSLVKNGLNLHGCVLSYYGRIRENYLSVVVYASCKYDSHDQRFKFEINDIHQTVSTISTYATKHVGDIIHTGRPQMEQVRNKERDYVKVQMENMSATEYFDRITETTDFNLVREGDFQKLRNIASYQQAHDEVKKEKRRYINSSDVSDIMGRYKEDQLTGDPYIRRVGEPFHVHMYSREQLNAVSNTDKVAHFDATGSIVRKPDANINNKKCEPSVYKRVFYYDLVINKVCEDQKRDMQNNPTTGEEKKNTTKKKGIQIPILEMVTCEQDIASISLLLAKYKIFVHSEHVKWPIFRVIVVDWSWALINSILKEWTGMTIGPYLEMAYNFAIGKKDLPPDLVIVHNCCAHFQNRMAKTIVKKFNTYKAHKSIVLEGTGIMIQCRTLTELDTAYENLMILLLSRSQERAQVVMTNLNNLRQGQDSYEDVFDSEVSEMDYLEDTSFHGSIFADSLFYKRYDGILKSLKEKLNTAEPNAENNEYYSEDLADHITKTHMPYAPMWSGILLSEVLPEYRKLSNAVAEGFFKIMKYNVLKSRKQLGIGEFVDITREYKEATCARSEIKTLLANTQPVQKEEILFSDGPENPLAREEFKRGQKRSARSHFEGRVIQKGAKKAKHLSNNIDTSSSMKSQRKKIKLTKDELTQKKISRKTDLKKNNSNKRVSHLREEISEFHTKKVSRETSVCRSSSSSQDSIHPRALVNALLLDPEYYMQEIIVDKTNASNTYLFYYVGSYWCDVERPIIGTAFLNLCSQDYKSIRNCEYINGPAIDCYAIGKMNTSEWGQDIIYVPTIETTYLLGDNCYRRKSKKWGMYHIVETLKGRILFPYVFKEHWRLFVLDVEAKTIRIFDPIQRNARDKKRAVNAFLRYLSSCKNSQEYVTNNLSDIDWTVTEDMDDRPMRKDSYNCGVYVLHYLDCLAKGKKLTDVEFDPASFRKQWMVDLLHLSQSIQYICYLCANDAKEWSVQCQNCKRWTHMKCIEQCERNCNDYVKDESLIHRCALSKSGEKFWM